MIPASLTTSDGGFRVRIIISRVNETLADYEF